MVAVHVNEVRFQSAAEVLALVRDFKFCTLPREQWTHHAHLTVALWHVLRYPHQTAVRLVREGIKRYNEAHGIRTTKTGGYHETITLFWMRVVRDYVRGVPTRRLTLAQLANGLVDRCPKDLPFAYYTRERLTSWDARTGWVEPDLKPLP